MYYSLGIVPVGALTPPGGCSTRSSPSTWRPSCARWRKPATARPCRSHVIAHGETGFFAHDDREWHGYLHALVSDPALRERVGRAARRHVEAWYALPRVVQDYVRLFDRLGATARSC
ncbi:MAG TPA: glycosyltransferase [Thermoanaerobaculaceae bacterium]|nr:glycosyltransferase [Thermoanaerobaculaceae bacterium]